MIARVLRIRGLVQGVGFRPYVWRLANELGLSGWVRNDGAGVLLTVNGLKVPEFLARLPRELPVLARIDRLESEAVSAEGLNGFVILASAAGAVVCPVAWAVSTSAAPARARATRSSTARVTASPSSQRASTPVHSGVR